MIAEKIVLKNRILKGTLIKSKILLKKQKSKNCLKLILNKI